MNGCGASVSWEKLQNASICLFWCRAISSHVGVSDLLLPMSECRFTLQKEFSEMSCILPPDVLSSCDLIPPSLPFISKKMDERLINGLLPSCFRSRVQGSCTGTRHPVRQWDWHSSCTVFTKETLKEHEHGKAGIGRHGPAEQPGYLVRCWHPHGKSLLSIVAKTP